MPSFPQSLPPSLSEQISAACIYKANHVYSAFTLTPVHPNGGIRKGLLSTVIALLSQLCLPFPFFAMDKLTALLFLLTLFIFNKDGRVTSGFKGSARASLTLRDGTQDQLAYHHNQEDHHDGGLSDQKGRVCVSLTVSYDHLFYFNSFHNSYRVHMYKQGVLSLAKSTRLFLC